MPEIERHALVDHYSIITGKGFLFQVDFSGMSAIYKLRTATGKV